ncbi:MAG: hypothetical protein RL757_1417 [Bacteroidota bacterium]|jgi:hypothetical protein
MEVEKEIEQAIQQIFNRFEETFKALASDLESAAQE